MTYPGLIHGFIDMGPWSAAAAAAVDDVVARIGKLLAADQPVARRPTTPEQAQTPDPRSAP